MFAFHFPNRSSHLCLLNFLSNCFIAFLYSTVLHLTNSFIAYFFSFYNEIFHIKLFASFMKRCMKLFLYGDWQLKGVSGGGERERTVKHLALCHLWNFQTGHFQLFFVLYVSATYSHGLFICDSK
jgi:hypothetical protein